MKYRRVGKALLIWEANPIIEALVTFAAWTEAPFKRRDYSEYFFELPQSHQARIELENPEDFVSIQGNTQQCEIVLFGWPSERLIRHAFNKRTSNNVIIRPGRGEPGEIVNLVA